MFNVTRRILALAVVAACSGTTIAHAQMIFTRLGSLSDKASGDALNYRSLSYGISGDGKVVGGQSIDDNGRVDAFRWTTDDYTSGTMEAIGNLGNGDQTSLVNDVSYNGKTLIGQSPWAIHEGLNSEAYRWTSGVGIQGLGRQIGNEAPNLGPYPAPFSVGYGVSDDGSVVVGHASSPNGPLEAFRWTQATGMTGLGGLLQDNVYSVGRSVSGDGSVIVGESVSAESIAGGTAGQFRVEAFRWTQATGMTGLGDLPGGEFDSVAFDISRDGSTVVGQGTSATGREAFRWTESDGMVGLDPGHLFSITSATGVSEDGRIVVGFANIPVGSQPDATARAFVWTESQGIRDLTDILTAEGINISDLGWDSLYDIQEISADGTTIVGNGFRQEGYRETFILHDVNRFGLGAVAVPEPTSLAFLGLGVLPLIGAGIVRRRTTLPIR